MRGIIYTERKKKKIHRTLAGHCQTAFQVDLKEAHNLGPTFQDQISRPPTKETPGPV